MVSLSADSLALLRASCKDDAAYQAVLALFEEHEAQIKRDSAADRATLDILMQAAHRFPGGAYGVFDRNKRYVVVGGESVTRRGTDPALLTGKTVYDLYAEEDEGRHAVRRERVYERVLSGETVDEDIELDGRVYMTRQCPLYGQTGEIIGGVVTSVDVTAYRQEESRLRRSEGLYRYLFEHSSAVKLWIDPITMAIIEANTAAARFYGYSREQLCNLTIHDISIIEPEMLKTYFSKTRAAGSGSFSFQQRGANGITYEVLAYVTMVNWGGERFVDATLLDMTDMARAREALLQSERFIRQITLTIPDVICVYDTVKGKAQFVNRHIGAMLGYGDEVYEGRSMTLQKLVHPEDLPLMIEHLESMTGVSENEVHQLECRFKHRNGSVRWFLLRTALFDWAQNDTPHEVLCLVHDITERKKSETEMRRSEERYRLFVRGIQNMAVMMVDHDLRYVLAEGELLATTGYSKEDMEGRTVDEVISPEAVDMLKALYRRALGGEEFQFEFVHDEGAYLAHYIPMVDSTDSVYAVMVVVQDITDFRHAENQRMQLALREKQVRMLSEFITSASHQFGTPLSIITSSASLMLHPRNKEDLQRHVDKILTQVESIGHLISSLALMTRLDAESHFQPTLCYLNGIVEGAWLTVQSRAQARDIAVALELSPEPLRYTGDPQYLHEAFVQLLDNAIRYTPDGGKVSVQLKTTPESYVIEIADSGVGIAPEHHPHVFERFYRADYAQTTSGFGLGLSIAAKVIERHKGTITFESVPDEGTTFMIHLPRA